MYIIIASQTPLLFEIGRRGESLVNRPNSLTGTEKLLH